MKTILIFDYFLPSGHQKLNNSFLELLSEKYNLVVVNSRNYFSCNSSKVRFINVQLLSTKVNNKYLRLIAHIINFIICRFAIIGQKYDDVLMTTYENLSMGYLHCILPNKRIIVFEHYNVDSLQKPSNKKLFLRYCNKVAHIVFAPYIKEYLCTVGVKSDNIHYVPHPLFNEQSPSHTKNHNKNKLILCPGLSNDEKIMKEIVEYEQSTNYLQEHNIHLILRVPSCSQLEVKLPNISLWRGFISAEEYEQKYNDADGILILYPTTYRYRFASVILNALTKKKVVFGNDIEIINFFASNYPSNCRSFKRIEELFTNLSSNFQFDESEYKQFIYAHSDSSVMISLINCLK